MSMCKKWLFGLRHVGKKNALELMLEESEYNKNNVQINEGSYLIDIRRADVKEHTSRRAAGAESDNLISFERMIRNIENRFDDE